MSNGLRWTDEQLIAHQRRTSINQRATAPTPPLDAVVTEEVKATKYRSRRAMVDGKKFDSQLEAKYYIKLKLLRIEGTVQWFLRQVPFELPGGIRYRLDFLVVRPSEKQSRYIDLVDCKGVLTQVSKNKIKQTEEIYGVNIILASKDDVKGISLRHIEGAP